MKKINTFRMVCVTMLIMILGITLSTNAQSANLRWASSVEAYTIKGLYLDGVAKVQPYNQKDPVYVSGNVYAHTEHDITKNGSVIYSFPDSVFINDQTGNSNGLVINTYRMVWYDPISDYIVGDTRTWIFNYNTNTISSKVAPMVRPGYSISGKTKSIFGFEYLYLYDGSNVSGPFATADGNLIAFITAVTCKPNTDSFFVAANMMTGPYQNAVYLFINGVFTLIAGTNDLDFIDHLTIYDTILYIQGDGLLHLGTKTAISSNPIFALDLANNNFSEISFIDGMPVGLMLVGIDNNLTISSGDQLYKVTTTTGVQDIANIKISIYPNPATDFVTISGYDEEVSVYSTIGTVVAIGKEKIDVSQLQAGMYFVKNEQGQYLAQFIKK